VWQSVACFADRWDLRPAVGFHRALCSRQQPGGVPSHTLLEVLNRRGFASGVARMNTRQFAAHGAKQSQQALLGQRRYLDLDESGPSDGRFNGFATQFANKPPSANSCGRVVSANSWRGTFCELQFYSAKCFVKKKFPAKALGGEVSLAGNFTLAFLPISLKLPRHRNNRISPQN